MRRIRPSARAGGEGQDWGLYRSRDRCLCRLAARNEAAREREDALQVVTDRRNGSPAKDARRRRRAVFSHFPSAGTVRAAAHSKSMRKIPMELGGLHGVPTNTAGLRHELYVEPAAPRWSGDG